MLFLCTGTRNTQVVWYALVTTDVSPAGLVDPPIPLGVQSLFVRCLPQTAKKGWLTPDHRPAMAAFGDTRTHAPGRISDLLLGEVAQTNEFVSVRGMSESTGRSAKCDSIGAIQTVASEPPIRTCCCNGAAITQIRIDGRVAQNRKRSSNRHLRTMRSVCRWCPREDSNLHGRKGHMNLNHARLPIPPLGLGSRNRIKACRHEQVP